ncbi:MAG: GTP-binding protein [Mariniphaga sp.]
MNAISVNIISGFLGSGKTTSIIRLLSQRTVNDSWAIIINEFGKVSIDSQTLINSGLNNSDLFDISGGCICCSAKIYFREDLEKIVASSKYNRIIIEPSGLGGIEMVSEIVEANPLLRLLPTICLVDILMTQNQKLQRLPIYLTQIRKASIIAFTKCDLTKDENELNGLIGQFKKNFPDKLCLAIRSDCDFSLLFKDLETLPTSKDGKFQSVFFTSQDLNDTNFREEVFTSGPEKVFDLQKMASFFSANPSIVRSKGYFRTIVGWHFYNYTLTGFHSEPWETKAFSQFVIISMGNEAIESQFFFNETEGQP